jgi:4-carboxymuconolactone decarboxylase
MTKTFTSPRYEAGAALLDQLGQGAGGLHRWQAVDPEVGPELDRMLGEFCFGDVWCREALDLRTRRIITLTAIAVLGRPTLLKSHVLGALQQGFTRQDLLEVFVHLIPYAGFPVCLSSIEAAVEVFDELDATDS